MEAIERSAGVDSCRRTSTASPATQVCCWWSPKKAISRAKLEEEKDDSSKIHVTRKGEPIGPYSREKAKEYFIAGTLLPTD